MLSVTILVALLQVAARPEGSIPAPEPDNAAMTARLTQAAPDPAVAPGVTLAGYRVEGRTPRARSRLAVTVGVA